MPEMFSLHPWLKYIAKIGLGSAVMETWSLIRQMVLIKDFSENLAKNGPYFGPTSLFLKISE